MPFGESFLATIKSNKSIMLDKSKRFRKTLGGFDSSKNQKLNLPKSTPKQLEEIRLRIQKENKKTEMKLFLIAATIALILMFILVYILI